MNTLNINNTYSINKAFNKFKGVFANAFNTKNTDYIDSNKKSLLTLNKLKTFESIWDYQSNFIESPNQRRGGFSGVSYLVLHAYGFEKNAEYGVFLKRQKNHTRKTYMHPIEGESTYEREYKMLTYAKSKNILVPRPIYFAKRKISDSQFAVLITEELKGFESLDKFNQRQLQNPESKNAQKKLIPALAKAIRNLHNAKIVHRSLYPKHIFVKTNAKNDHFNIAVIDMEKSRISRSDTHRTITDLASLNRHAENDWTRTMKLRFFLNYMNIHKLTPETKNLCSTIFTRSMREHQNKSQN